MGGLLFEFLNAAGALSQKSDSETDFHVEDLSCSSPTGPWEPVSENL